MVSIFSSNDLVSLESSGLQLRLGRLAILKGADKGIRVFFLIQVAQCMVYTAVASFVCANVQNQVPHGAVTLGHIPVLELVSYCLVGRVNLKYLPEWQCRGS